MHDIVNIEEFQSAIKCKSDFELAREFVLWDTGDMKFITKELNHRRGALSFFILFLVGLFTNTLLFFTEVQASFRWLYFEDRPNQIIRQYVAGFLYISILPALFGLAGFFQKNFDEFFSVSTFVYGIVFIIGITKTFYDIIKFIKFLRYK